MEFLEEYLKEFLEKSQVASHQGFPGKMIRKWIFERALDYYREIKGNIF